MATLNNQRVIQMFQTTNQWNQRTYDVDRWLAGNPLSEMAGSGCSTGTGWIFPNSRPELPQRPIVATFPDMQQIHPGMVISS